MAKKNKIIGRAALCILVAVGAIHAQDYWHMPLPHRQALDKDVRFWKKIFAEVSLNQFVIHDSEDLSRIYKIVTLDSTLTRRQQEKQLKAIKEEVEQLLRRFHEKDFAVSELSYWEHQVYRMFLSDKNPDKFLEASRRVRAQQGIKEKFLAGVRRSFAYLEHIEDEFRKAGLPRALIYLPHVESSFHPSARSHVGATGMWQFMRRTGRQYMKVNRIKDERYDPIHSTRAAAKLLKFNYRLLKDWALAITAYNHGLGSMLKAKARYGDYLTIRENYLRRSFGFASKNFYPEVLAVVEICDSLEKYAPDVRKDPPLTFQEIRLPRAVNIRTLARAHDLDIAVLQQLNPGFTRRVWNGQLRIPAKYTLRLPIMADSRSILAALGADEADFEDVLVAAHIPGGEGLRIVRMGDLMQRNRTVRRHLRQLRYGAYPPPEVPHVVAGPEYLFALTNPVTEAPQTLLADVDAPAAEAPRQATPTVAEPHPAASLAGVATPPGGTTALPGPVAAAGNEIAATTFLTMGTVLSPAAASAVVRGRPGVDAAATPITSFQWQMEAPLLAAVEEPPASPPEQPRVGGRPAEILPNNEASTWQLIAEAGQLSYPQMMRQLRKRLTPEQNEIVVFPQETLGHYADWAGVSVQELRRLNGIRSRQKLKTGQRFQMKFGYRTPVEFLEKRLAYHTGLIQNLLKGASHLELVEHTILPGENLWQLAHKKYNFPVNLLLYFNDLNKLEDLYPGDIIKLPVVY